MEERERERTKGKWMRNKYNIKINSLAGVQKGFSPPHYWKSLMRKKERERERDYFTTLRPVYTSHFSICIHCDVLYF